MGHIALDQEQRSRLADRQREACHGTAVLDEDICEHQIRAIRMRHESSLAFMSRYTNKCRSTLSRYELGATRIPMSTAIIILNKLGYVVKLEKVARESTL